MKKISIVFALFCALGLFSCEELDENIPEGLTNEEIIAGLKNALTVGTDTSVTTLNAMDGYFRDELVKVLMPKEAQPILAAVDDLNKHAGVNLQPLIDDVVLSMNRSAEKAAVKAKPIFVDAITNMTITDGIGILNGSDSAATEYLRANTFNSLSEAFTPDIKSVLDDPVIGTNSTESLYSELVTQYNTGVSAFNTANTLAFGTLGENKTKINGTSLSQHVTERALKGLFLKVRDEEKDIRKDPVARVTDILTKVFGELDKN